MRSVTWDEPDVLQAVYVHAQLKGDATTDDVEAHMLPAIEVVNFPAFKGETHHVNNIDDKKRQTEHNSSKDADFIPVGEIEAR